MVSRDPVTHRRSTGYHEPVLVEEVLGFLLPAPGPILDGTVGGGGHARAILERDSTVELIAVDRDPQALDEAKRALAPFAERVRFVSATFFDVVATAGLPDEVLGGVLLDLGVSSHQLDSDARGFAFRQGVPLDMRMEGRGAEGESARSILERAEPEELAAIFRDFGELPQAKRLAREVVRAREAGRPLETSDDLVACLSRVLGRSPGASEKARVFQAIRIAVNRELEGLAEALPRLRDALRPQGTMAVIAYHSLEDRIVKNTFREWSRSCVCPPGLPVCTCRGEPLGKTLTGKPVRPSDQEVEANPRARSALLRAWRKAA